MAVFENIDRLKTQYTDKYVVVAADRPELRRFHGLTGTVNLTVSATSTESSNGSTASTASQTMSIVVSETTNTITGTVSGETLTGTAAGDHIQGLAGNDTANSPVRASALAIRDSMSRSESRYCDTR